MTPMIRAIVILLGALMAWGSGVAGQAPPQTMFRSGVDLVTIDVVATTANGAPVHNLRADDDAQYSSGANTPLNNAGSPVELVISKHRGPGNVMIADPRLEDDGDQGRQAGRAVLGQSLDDGHVRRAG